MTAPRWIWADLESGMTEYIRADLHDAAMAKAREALMMTKLLLTTIEPVGQSPWSGRLPAGNWGALVELTDAALAALEGK